MLDPAALSRRSTSGYGLDGVYGGLVYPSTGLPLYGMENQELLRAVFAAYNDWLAEFCNAYPARLKGIAEVLWTMTLKLAFLNSGAPRT